MVNYIPVAILTIVNIANTIVSATIGLNFFINTTDHHITAGTHSNMGNCSRHKSVRPHVPLLNLSTMTSVSSCCLSTIATIAAMVNIMRHIFFTFIIEKEELTYPQLYITKKR